MCARNHGRFPPNHYDHNSGRGARVHSREGSGREVATLPRAFRSSPRRAGRGPTSGGGGRTRGGRILHCLTGHHSSAPDPTGGLEIAEELLEQRSWTLRDLLPPAPSAQRGAVSRESENRSNVPRIARIGAWRSPYREVNARTKGSGKVAGRLGTWFTRFTGGWG